MTLTAATAQQHLEHALAGASELEALSILNQAGRYLVSMRNWRWLRGGAATLGTVSGQSYVELPEDCKAVKAIEQTNSLSGAFEFIGLQDFLNYKTSSITTSPISYWGTIVWGRDTYANAGTEKPGAPAKRIELFPTPTSTAASAFTIYYDRGWVELTEDNQAVTIPAFLEALYLALCRAFALGYEEEASGTVDMRLAATTGGPLYAMAMREDIAAQPNIGHLQNGIGGASAALNRWSGASIGL